MGRKLLEKMKMSGVEEAPGCQLDRILAEGRTGWSDTRVVDLSKLTSQYSC